MQQHISLRLSPAEASDNGSIKKKIAASCSKKLSSISGYHIIKRSIDARDQHVFINLTVNVFIDEPFHERELTRFSFKDTTNATKKVVIIAAWPLHLCLFLKRSVVYPLPAVSGRQINLPARDRKSTRLNSSHLRLSRMPSSA